MQKWGMKGMFIADNSAILVIKIQNPLTFLIKKLTG